MRIHKIALSAMTLGLAVVATGCATVSQSKQPIAAGAGFVPSFQVEVLPQRAACERKDYDGNLVQTTCVQIRHAGSDEIVLLKTAIQGFAATEGVHYVLDLRQIPTPRTDYATQQPIWALNKIISQQ
ncbi:hypothetical protein [Moraxella sp.]|uniref:hypothetical protein n=1 Tax=Moraxella sp. TaxID=479 RepID=UPI0026DAB33D|nr:hypothetical protein [Moraxella sp.]MDO4895502.1 hypothetical protein [Moraxella sp.]